MYKLILILFLNVISINCIKEIQPTIIENKFNIKLLYSNQELEDLNNRILYFSNQSDHQLENLDSIIINYIIRYDYKNHKRKLNKKDFLNNSFLNNLSLSKTKYNLFHPKRMTYIDVEVILEDNNQKCIGIGDVYSVSFDKQSNDSFQKIINAKYELNLVHFFTIREFRNWEIFGLSKNNKVYVFRFRKGGLMIHKLEDYVNEHPEIFSE